MQNESSTLPVIEEFEQRIAEFFGSPFAVAVDSCTHGIELCLRMTDSPYMISPIRTYVSVPMLAWKLNIPLIWNRDEWQDYYHVTGRIIDAAVLWKRNSYIPGVMMCLSFQYQKHLSLGRGGMILLDNEDEYRLLKKMVYDGREPNIPWREQNISTIGYHYYMTPETAVEGLKKLDRAINTEPRKWVFTDWPDLTKMDIFNQ